MEIVTMKLRLEQQELLLQARHWSVLKIKDWRLPDSYRFVFEKIVLVCRNVIYNSALINIVHTNFQFALFAQKFQMPNFIALQFAVFWQIEVSDQIL
ncbi:hypothetical protein BpHYR1_022412 [Brachionus plicatilis]|uniref:Uncharacterized protein n=1 Tax=Brachionus plicatilis TaxID=10195 RepID=A0A3M7QB38_BRAPC|nr:hypothetical protein BpHYR1_022412 [Brachionus plicatilis]